MSKASTPRLYLGTSGYACKDWKGSFYPDDLPAKRMLGFYSERFDAVEINASFYRLPTAATLAAWASEVPASFRFTMKAPQQITHFRRLKDVEGLTNEFVDVSATLGERLGPLLFGLPPNMKKDAGRMREFLAVVPRGVRLAFEFRHQSWFDDEVLEVLRTRAGGAALCIADADDELEVPFEATADWGYLRLRREKYGTPTLKKWVARVLAQKWRETYVFFKHEDTGTGPKFAKSFLKLAAL